jgi:hypothetical protein
MHPAGGRDCVVFVVRCGVMTCVQCTLKLDEKQLLAFIVFCWFVTTVPMFCFLFVKCLGLLCCLISQGATVNVFCKENGFASVVDLILLCSDPALASIPDPECFKKEILTFFLPHLSSKLKIISILCKEDTAILYLWKSLKFCSCQLLVGNKT